MTSIQETYDEFIFKIKSHNLVEWNNFHCHCKEKKRSQESLGNQAIVLSGQNFMNDLDEVIQGTFIELDVAWSWEE